MSRSITHKNVLNTHTKIKIVPLGFKELSSKYENYIIFYLYEFKIVIAPSIATPNNPLFSFINNLSAELCNQNVHRVHTSTPLQKF